VALRGDAALDFGVEEPESLMSVAVVQRLVRDFGRELAAFAMTLRCCNHGSFDLR
jgi:hypothetical protein